MPRCSQCPSTSKKRDFPTDLALRQHQASAHPGGNSRKLPCNECPRSFDSRDALAAHKQANHSRASAHSFNCGCGDQFSSPSALENHKRAKHSRTPSSPQNFNCGCGDQFSSASALENHKRAKHSGAPSSTHSFNCGCGQQFSSQSALNNHKAAKHTGATASPRKFGCGCGAQFDSQSALENHSRAVHQPKVITRTPSSISRPSSTITRIGPSSRSPSIMYPPYQPVMNASPTLAKCSVCNAMFEPSDLSDHILLQHAPAQSPPVRPAIQSFQLTAVDSAYLGPRPDSFIQPGEDGISLPNQFEDWRAANPATLAPVVMIDQTPSPTNTFLLPTMRTLLDANKGKIYPEINRLSGLSPEDWQLCTLSIDKIPIYPKLLAHTYMHLALCVEDTSALSELKGCLEAWMSWNNPDITFLINHKLIRSSLVGFLQKSWSGEHMCPRGLQLSDDGKLPDTDIISIGAHVAMILAEETKVRELLSLKDEDAQTVLDLLQALLDISGINPDARRQFLHTLIQLSTNSGRFPQCLTLRPNELEYDHRDYIGQGGFGYVCEGLLLNHKVAVKVLQVKRGGMDQLLKTCSREAAVWCHLDHPNVLPFYGIYHSAEEDFSACLVSPFMERGDIRTYLSNNENVDRSSLVLDVAKGLQYLHENKPTIIHGDLKGANILVSASGRACLADFGLSLAKDSQHLQPSTTQSPLGFTLRWTPPEHLDPALANLSQHSAVRGRMSDIYSFACVCYEIYTSKDPFHGVLGQLIPGLVLAGRRPVKPSPEEWDETGLEDAMWDMIVACWDQKPEQRPTTAQVVKFVEFRYPSLSNITTESAWIPSFLADLASTHANHPFSCMVPRVENLTT